MKNTSRYRDFLRQETAVDADSAYSTLFLLQVRVSVWHIPWAERLEVMLLP